MTRGGWKTDCQSLGYCVAKGLLNNHCLGEMAEAGYEQRRAKKSKERERNATHFDKVKGFG